MPRRRRFQPKYHRRDWNVHNKRPQGVSIKANHMNREERRKVKRALMDGEQPLPYQSHQALWLIL